MFQGHLHSFPEAQRPSWQGVVATHVCRHDTCIWICRTLLIGILSSHCCVTRCQPDTPVWDAPACTGHAMNAHSFSLCCCQALRRILGVSQRWGVAVQAGAGYGSPSTSSGLHKHSSTASPLHALRKGVPARLPLSNPMIVALFAAELLLPVYLVVCCDAHAVSCARGAGGCCIWDRRAASLLHTLYLYSSAG